MEFFSFNDKTNKPNFTRNVLLSIFESMSYIKFYTLIVDDGTKITDKCWFEIYECVAGFCRDVPRMSPKSDGFLLIEVDRPDQIIEKPITIGKTLVSCTPHKPLNLTRGVVYYRDLM